MDDLVVGARDTGVSPEFLQEWELRDPYNLLVRRVRRRCRSCLRPCPSRNRFRSVRHGPRMRR